MVRRSSNRRRQPKAGESRLCYMFNGLVSARSLSRKLPPIATIFKSPICTCPSSLRSLAIPRGVPSWDLPASRAAPVHNIPAARPGRVDRDGGGEGQPTCPSTARRRVRSPSDGTPQRRRKDQSRFQARQDAPPMPSTMANIVARRSPQCEADSNFARFAAQPSKRDHAIQANGGKDER